MPERPERPRMSSLEMGYDLAMNKAADFERGREAQIQAVYTGIEMYFGSPSGLREDSASFPEGHARLLWPNGGLSEKSCAEFKKWLDQIAEKVTRAAGLSDEPAKE